MTQVGREEEAEVTRLERPNFLKVLSIVCRKHTSLYTRALTFENPSQAGARIILALDFGQQEHAADGAGECGARCPGDILSALTKPLH